ncbi:MAG: response regulator transcription factor [Candidatus Acidiferrales bacterium]
MPNSHLVVDDNAVARRLIRSLLATRFEGDPCAEAADGVEAVEKAKAAHPDVAILDIVMPRLNGVDAARQIVQTSPETAVLVISFYDPRPILSRLADAGARGFVSKSSMDVELVPAIEALLEGRTYFNVQPTRS